jgi:hypothetical protein
MQCTFRHRSHNRAATARSTARHPCHSPPLHGHPHRNHINADHSRPRTHSEEASSQPPMNVEVFPLIRSARLHPIYPIHRRHLQHSDACVRRGCCCCVCSAAAAMPAPRLLLPLRTPAAPCESSRVVGARAGGVRAEALVPLWIRHRRKTWRRSKSAVKNTRIQCTQWAVHLNTLRPCLHIIRVPHCYKKLSPQPGLLPISPHTHPPSFCPNCPGAPCPFQSPSWARWT